MNTSGNKKKGSDMNTRKINNRAEDIIADMKAIIEAVKNGNKKAIAFNISDAEEMLFKLKEAAK